MSLFKYNVKNNAEPPRESRATNGNTNSPPWASSFFSKTSRSPDAQSTTSASTRGSFFFRRSPSEEDTARLSKDPTISAARRKLIDAESAEKEAGRALNLARAAVKDARDHAKVPEPLSRARRAKAKQAEAKSVRKSAQGLGRYN